MCGRHVAGLFRLRHHSQSIQVDVTECSLLFLSVIFHLVRVIDEILGR